MWNLYDQCDGDNFPSLSIEEGLNLTGRRTFSVSIPRMGSI